MASNNYLGPKKWAAPTDPAELDLLKRRFLEAYVQTGAVIAAAMELGIPRDAVYRWCRRDPAFAQQFEEAAGGAFKTQSMRALERLNSRKEAFLEAYALLGTINKACVATKMNHHTILKLLNTEPAFAEEFERARQRSTDALEAECRRRAVEGTHEPVFYQGEIVGYIKKYSDVCLLALLNAHRSERFKHRHEHTGRDGGPIAVVHVSYDHNMQPDDMVIEVTNKQLVSSLLDERKDGES